MCLCSLPLIAVAYLDGTLAIYDLSTQMLRHSCRHEVCICRSVTRKLGTVKLGPQNPLNSPFLQAGLVHLQWEESSSLVSTCSLDGVLRQWDARSGKIVSEYSGHAAEILDFSINRLDSMLIHFNSRLDRCLTLFISCREATVAVTASGDNQAKVFCLQRPDR